MTRIFFTYGDTQLLSRVSTISTIYRSTTIFRFENPFLRSVYASVIREIEFMLRTKNFEIEILRKIFCCSRHKFQTYINAYTLILEKDFRICKREKK